MITVTEYKDKHIGVFGLGKAGEATVAALLAGGAKVWAWDDKKEVDSDQRSAISEKKDNTGRWPLAAVHYSSWPWKDIKALVLSPGVPLTHPKPHAVVEMAEQHDCPVIGDIELLTRACPETRIIGITGTNGKSTTTTLIGHILKTCGVKAEVGGNLGTAALALAPLGMEGTYVLELSSYQLDLLHTARFNIAVWLNITPDHIDRHGNMEGYIAAKMHLFDRQRADDMAIIGVDDAFSAAVADTVKQKKKQRVIEISVRSKAEGGVCVKDGWLHDNIDPTPQRFDLNPIITLTGRHNWQNAAMAYATARACGLHADAIYKAMTSFAGLRHRLQLVATVNGVRFINDSKATNADATSNALAPYESIYWIAGGKQKEGGIEPLAPYFPKIAHVFLIGESEDAFAETLRGKAPFTLCGTLKTALEKAAKQAFTEKKKNAVVLLSPACASFDQFKNFEERGDQFCQMVEALAAGEKGNKIAV